MSPSLKKSDPARGFAAGCASGLVATAVLTAFQQATVAAAKGYQHRAAAADPMAGLAAADPRSAASGPIRQSEAVNTAMARSATAVGRLFGVDLTRRTTPLVGMAIHFAFGTLVGGLYGWLAEVWPTVTLAGGTAFGTALWLGADELAVPALGLMNPPTRNPPPMHAAAWSVHLVYGAVLEARTSAAAAIRRGASRGPRQSRLKPP